VNREGQPPAALSVGDLVDIEEKYGSLEAAAEALPEHREQLLAAIETAADFSAKFRKVIDSLPHFPEISVSRRETPKPVEPLLDLGSLYAAVEEIEPAAHLDLEAAIDAALAKYLPPLVDDEEREPGRRGARRTRIPTRSWWFILEQRVKKGEDASIRWLSEHTRHSEKYDFVGRTLVGELVNWIDDNPERARRAWDRHEIPREFRATRDGVLVPGP
jgi:hypothetical protein